MGYKCSDTINMTSRLELQVSGGLALANFDMKHHKGKVGTFLCKMRAIAPRAVG